MTSLLTSPRQISRDTGYFIPLGDLRGKIFEYAPPGAVGATISSGFPAAWAYTNLTTAPFISSAGAGVLKDMGKTFVSSARVFRKVQLVFSTASLLIGQGISNTVGGAASGVGEDYLTGYIELGFNGGTPTPVAAYGR